MLSGNAARGGGAKPAGQIIRAILSRKKFYEKGKYGAVARAWAKQMSGRAAAQTRIRALRGGELVVEVSSPALLHELNGFMKKQLLNALQATPGGREVVRIRFCLSRGEADSMTGIPEEEK